MVGFFVGDGIENATSYLMSLVAFCAMCTGCLVTEHVRFDEEENVPPVFFDSNNSTTPIGSLIVVKKEPANKELTFELMVRDENVDQVLESRYVLFAMFDLTPGLLTSSYWTIDTNGSPVRDEIKITIGILSFNPGQCYQLEYAASSKFASSKPQNPQNPWDKTVEQDDLAKAKWLIAYIPDESTNTSKCPNVELTSTPVSTDGGATNK